MWEHFNKVLGQEKIECLYCGTLICCVSRQGTRLMHHRLVRCKEYPYADVGKRQKSASGQVVGGGSSLGPQKFDQDTSRKELAVKFILSELSFKLVDYDGFH